MGSNNKRTRKQTKTLVAYKQVFADEQGQLVLEDLMIAGSVLGSTTFVPNDPYQSAFNEGQRQIVMRILTQIGMDLEKFAQLVETIGEDDEDII